MSTPKPNHRWTVVSYTAPSCWAPYLINGDASGIEDADQAEADAMVDQVGCGSPVSCEDAGFVHRPDFGKLAGDCQTYSFLKPNPKWINK